MFCKNFFSLYTLLLYHFTKKFDKIKGMEISEAKKEIIKTGEKLGRKNMSPGTSGNISLRLGENILITASGTCLYELEENEIVLMDRNGNLLEGSRKPSSEKHLHTKIYQMRPDINAIVHCHAPYVSTFAVCHKPLSRPIISENVFYFGEIPVAKYAMPSSNELVENTAKFFVMHDAVLMANHGIIVGGKNLREAYFKSETAEIYAQIYLQSLILGSPVDLEKRHIEEIYELRNAIGK